MASTAISPSDRQDTSSAHPIRPGEKNCPHFLRTGICHFNAKCKFNHPPRVSVPTATSPATCLSPVQLQVYPPQPSATCMHTITTIVTLAVPMQLILASAMVLSPWCALVCAYMRPKQGGFDNQANRDGRNVIRRDVENQKKEKSLFCYSSRVISAFFGF
jgi:hypothetical protein